MTEDIGTVLASPSLRYQADYENERRFLSFDLLCGRVDRHHPLHQHLLREGAEARELAWFVEHPCPPDLLGVNYYATSDRYLDARLDAYPPARHGGNGQDAYVDLEAVRGPGAGLAGHEHTLRVVWERYGLPIVLSEVHLGCTREEQLRWLSEAHGAVLRVRKQGVDVRALTVWALLGAFDWNSLVVEARGHYESGVFDVRCETPRPTALASMVEGLAKHGHYDHPVLATPGWWHRARPPVAARRPSARPLLLAGAGGALGRAFGVACRARGLEVVMLERSQLDIAEPAEVAAAIARHRPWAVINAAGTRRGGSETSEPRCLRDDVRGAEVLAELCRGQGLRLVTFSNDLVFDGQQRQPYLEHDVVAPMCVLGRAKAEAERRVLDILPDALVVRSGILLSNGLTPAGAKRLVDLSGSAHLTMSPSYAPHLVHACLDLMIDGAAGIWHLANVGAITWPHLMQQLAERSGLDDTRHRDADTLDDEQDYRVLGSARAAVMPSLEDALDAWLRQVGDAA